MQPGITGTGHVEQSSRFGPERRRICHPFRLGTCLDCYAPALRVSGTAASFV
jgi:hypothetical protein